MKKYVVAIFLMLLGSIGPKALAGASPPPIAVPSGLAIAELKTAGDEFIVLLNNGPTITDLSQYWLIAFNNTNPSTAGTTSSSQQLPIGSLGTGQTVLLKDNGGSTCGAAITGGVSVTLNDRNGFLEVAKITSFGVVTIGDTVSWSQNANDLTMIGNIPSSSSSNVYYRYQSSLSPPTYAWKTASLSATDNCQLEVASVAVDDSAGSQLLPGDEPPAIILSSDNSISLGVGLPAADIGLNAPRITELLPNPAEPQTDSEDEFIELYNSNDVVFDLTGFKLQTGTTNLHTYTFPAGSNLAPKSFTAFYSIDTGLSLSNTNGQARLLDPAGNTISQADVYGTAPDGQSWALADGTWYWTTMPTPGDANIINQPLGIKTLSVGTTTATTKKSATAASKTTTTPKVKAASTSSGNVSSSSAAKNATPLHPLVLAGVGAGAVAYAAYEYRNDLANRLYQFRRYAASRAAAGATAGSAGPAGTKIRFRWWQNNFRSRFSSWFRK